MPSKSHFLYILPLLAQAHSKFGLRFGQKIRILINIPKWIVEGKKGSRGGKSRRQEVWLKVRNFGMLRLHNK